MKILVLGGTGSIGSEIVRQLLKTSPDVIRIYSRSEEKQFNLKQELGNNKNIRFLIGDIRDPDRLYDAMEGIDYVFNTAAMKHVELCEYNPMEAVKTNVMGTENVIQCAKQQGVKKVIAISTDKSVNPVNVMGITKKLSESLITHANQSCDTTVFSCVRFGNVLGSSGSLVPIIRKQIAEGKEVTLTDTRMTRFIMTIPDAVKLAIDVLDKMQGGEIFILKMPSVSIMDLIDVVVGSSSYGVKVIGKRTGEKLYEELLSEEELPYAEESDRYFVITDKECHVDIDKKLYDSRYADYLSVKKIKKIVDKL